MLWCLLIEATESTRVGKIVIFDVFVALQVTETCNPLETARKVLAGQLSKAERILGIERGEPDPRTFVVLRAIFPERQPLRTHVFVIHLFSRANTESNVRLRGKKSTLFGQFIRPFIPWIPHVGFDPVNAKIVAPAVAINGADRFSTLQ